MVCQRLRLRLLGEERGGLDASAKKGERESKVNRDGSKQKLAGSGIEVQ
jgi:hypothetical protein